MHKNEKTFCNIKSTKAIKQEDVRSKIQNKIAALLAMHYRFLRLNSSCAILMQNALQFRNGNLTRTFEPWLQAVVSLTLYWRLKLKYKVLEKKQESNRLTT